VGEPGAKAIIVLPEVFGWGGRLKGICDTLAAEGYFVVMPDCHRGTTAAGQEDFGAWCKGYSWESHIKEDFTKLFKLLGEKGATSVGAIGFCWGAWALCKASGEGFDLKCGVGPHPSTKLEGMCFGGSEAEMMSAVKMPVLLMPAGDDPDNVKEGGEIAEIIVGKGGATEAFAEMTHGWVSRGDMSDAAVKSGVESALGKAIVHFKVHLVSDADVAAATKGVAATKGGASKPKRPSLFSSLFAQPSSNSNANDTPKDTPRDSVPPRSLWSSLTGSKPSYTTIVGSDGALSEVTCGGKGLKLGQMAGQSLPVPPFVIVPTAVCAALLYGAADGVTDGGTAGAALAGGGTLTALIDSVLSGAGAEAELLQIRERILQLTIPDAVGDELLGK
jgi:dienelactone hydrolase